MRPLEQLVRRLDVQFAAVAPSIRITAFAPPKPRAGVREDDESTIFGD